MKISSSNKTSFWNWLTDRYPIQKKLLVTLVPVTAACFLLLLAIIYFVSFQESQRLVNVQADIIADQQIELVDSYLNKLRTETEVFMFGDEVQDMLRISKGDLSANDVEKLETDFRRAMYSILINYDMNIESITVKTAHDDYYVWRMDSRLRYGEFTGRLNRNQAAARSLGGEMYFTYDKLSSDLVTVTRQIKDPVSDTELGLMMVDFNLGALRRVSYTLSGRVETDPTLVIVNPFGDPLLNYSTLSDQDVALLSPDQPDLLLDGAKLRVFHTVSSLGDWDLYLVLNESLLYRNVYHMLFFQTGLTLLSVLLVMLSIYQVSRSISGQFRRFQNKLSRVSDPKDSKPIVTHTKDEFNDLALVYNEMMARIENLIDTVYAKELRLKEAEIKAFQAQINPHFLYNTLDCINGLADAHRPEDVKKTVTALAGIMRMSIKGPEILRVREDLYYVEQYMYIQKMRHGDSLLYMADLPPEILDYYLPKLVLQPLLENSIVHGFSGTLGGWMLGLFGQVREDCLVFSVKDNGRGFPEDVMEMINRTVFSQEEAIPFSRESIGLQNIQARIQLTYGQAYGLEIRNLPKGGACVTVKLPKLTEPPPPMT